MAENKNIPAVVFSPELAKQIADFVKNEIAKRNGETPIRGQITPKKTVPAKITGSAVSGTVWKHSWVQVRWNHSSLNWENIPDGKSGTTSTNYLINGADKEAKIPNDTVVIANRVDKPDTGESYWVGSGVAYEEVEVLVDVSCSGGDLMKTFATIRVPLG